jgi:hypothetical protein
MDCISLFNSYLDFLYLKSEETNESASGRKEMVKWCLGDRLKKEAKSAMNSNLRKQILILPLFALVNLTKLVRQ